MKKYKDIIFNSTSSIQWLLVIWKFLEWEPFNNWTWFQIFSPTIFGIIFLIICFIAIFICQFFIIFFLKYEDI